MRYIISMNSSCMNVYASISAIVTPKFNEVESWCIFALHLIRIDSKLCPCVIMWNLETRMWNSYPESSSFSQLWSEDFDIKRLWYYYGLQTLDASYKYKSSGIYPLALIRRIAQWKHICATPSDCMFNVLFLSKRMWRSTGHNFL